MGLAMDKASNACMFRCMPQAPYFSSELVNVVPEPLVGDNSHDTPTLSGLDLPGALTYEHREFAPLVNARAHQLVGSPG